MYGYDIKIYADAGREPFCRALGGAGLQPVFLPGVNGESWGYGVPAEDEATALEALEAAGIFVQKTQDMRLTRPTGALKKGARRGA
ncbi:hypothetical protein ACPCIZ_12835 [Streptomyces cellulosae]